MCHTKPSNATTPGHIDGTGGIVQAEIKFSTLNPSSTFNFTTDDVQRRNTATATAARAQARRRRGPRPTALTCTSCHLTPAPGQVATGMSGQHDKHIRDKGYACVTCHATVVNGTPAIISATLHVNGVKDVKMSQGTYTPSTKACSGLANGCHGTKTW